MRTMVAVMVAMATISSNGSERSTTPAFSTKVLDSGQNIYQSSLSLDRKLDLKVFCLLHEVSMVLLLG